MTNNASMSITIHKRALSTGHIKKKMVLAQNVLSSRSILFLVQGRSCNYVIELFDDLLPVSDQILPNTDTCL